jgi:phosphotriesterase-related protein
MSYTGPSSQRDYGLAPGETFEPDEEDHELEPVELAGPHIMTVLGPILPEELGVCLVHEHLLCDPIAVTTTDPDYRLDDPHATLAELEEFASVGGRAIVDCSTADYGRDADGLYWLAQRAPVHVIMVTGRHKALHAEGLSAGQSLDDLTAEILCEIQIGVGRHQVKPGVIKFGTSENAMMAVEEKAARAAARAHLATGLSITTHTEAGAYAHQQLDVLAEEGVSPDRVILGHLDRKLDRGYLISLLDRGAWISLDQIGKAYYGPDEPKARMVADLVGDGYGNQLLLSMDLARKSLLRAHGGDPGWVYMIERFALMLMDNGLTAQQVHALLASNPAHALTITCPGGAYS